MEIWRFTRVHCGVAVLETTCGEFFSFLGYLALHRLNGLNVWVVGLNDQVLWWCLVQFHESFVVVFVNGIVFAIWQLGALGLLMAAWSSRPKARLFQVTARRLWTIHSLDMHFSIHANNKLPFDLAVLPTKPRSWYGRLEMNLIKVLIRGWRVRNTRALRIIRLRRVTNSSLMARPWLCHLVLRLSQWLHIWLCLLLLWIVFRRNLWLLISHLGASALRMLLLRNARLWSLWHLNQIISVIKYISY